MAARPYTRKKKVGAAMLVAALEKQVGAAMLLAALQKHASQDAKSEQAGEKK